MESVIARIQQIIGEVPKKIKQFSPEEMAYKPTTIKWSKKEILGHLCDSALHNWQRFLNIQMQDGKFIVDSYLQDKLVQLNNYQNLPTGQIVALWKNMNRQIIAAIKNIPSANYVHPVQLPNGEIKDLKFLIEDYLIHLGHHLNQIFNNDISPQLPANWSINVKEALNKLTAHSEGKPFVTLLENNEMYVEIYQPNKIDLQTPHDQDEIYVVISGSGMFYNNGERKAFQAGDLIFVPAGIEHRFENFTEDFKTWVVFY